MESAFESKTSRVLGNTRKVASSLAKGKSLDSFIDKEAFNKLANKNYDANLVEQEQAFKHFYKAKNPNATSKEVDSAWDEQKDLMANSFAKGLNTKISNLNQTPYGTGQQALGSSMAKQFADDFKRMYANEENQHKGAFVKS